MKCAAEYDVQGEYERLKERGIRFVTAPEEEFPERLRKIPDPPYVLYYAGRLPAAEQKTVAIIGARDCTEYGRTIRGRAGTGGYTGYQRDGQRD